MTRNAKYQAKYRARYVRRGEALRQICTELADSKTEKGKRLLALAQEGLGG